MEQPAIFQDLMDAIRSADSDTRPLYRVTVKTHPEAEAKTWWVRTTTEYSARQAALAAISEVKRINSTDLVAALAEELKRARNAQPPERKDVGDDGSGTAG
jgi:hypothetical protein